MSDGMVGQVAHAATQAPLPSPSPMPGNAKSAPDTQPAPAPPIKTDQAAVGPTPGIPDKISTDELEQMLLTTNVH